MSNEREEWQWVPKEPNISMLEPLARSWCVANGLNPDAANSDGSAPIWYEHCSPYVEMYKAMLAAAPKPVWTDEMLTQLEQDAEMFLSKMSPLPSADAPKAPRLSDEEIYLAFEEARKEQRELMKNWCGVAELPSFNILFGRRVEKKVRGE